MLRFVEFLEVRKTATGREKSTSVVLSIDQIVAVRPTQHYKETSIALTNGTVIVEGLVSDVLQTLREASSAA